MSKTSIISVVATVMALLTVAPAAGYASEPVHNFQETRAQRDVAALHEAEQSTQSAARPTMQAAAPGSTQSAAQK